MVYYISLFVHVTDFQIERVRVTYVEVIQEKLRLWVSVFKSLESYVERTWLVLLEHFQVEFILGLTDQIHPEVKTDNASVFD